MTHGASGASSGRSVGGRRGPSGVADAPCVRTGRGSDHGSCTARNLSVTHRASDGGIRRAGSRTARPRCHLQAVGAARCVTDSRDPSAGRWRIGVVRAPIGLTHRASGRVQRVGMRRPIDRSVTPRASGPIGSQAACAAAIAGRRVTHGASRGAGTCRPGGRRNGVAGRSGALTHRASRAPGPLSEPTRTPGASAPAPGSVERSPGEPEWQARERDARCVTGWSGPWGPP